MEEELIYWWLTKPINLPFTILSTGLVNITDGPDIHNAELRIGCNVYCGNIEIDILKSSWLTHGHFKSMRFQYILVHIFKEDNSFQYTEGHIPLYSYCIETNELIKNDSKIQTKQNRLTNLSQYFDEETVFWLLLARTLGYFYNKDIMMAFAYEYIQNGKVTNPLESFSKSVRPNNRIERRREQFLRLYHSKNFFLKSKSILQMRLNYSDMINAIVLHFNRVLGENYNLDAQRIIQFVSYYFIPLLLHNESKINENMIYYLADLKRQSKKEKIIEKYA